MKKPRSDKKLNFPEGDERAVKLWQWLCTPGLTYDAILTLVKDEFGIETSTRALSEWWQDHAEQQEEQRIISASHIADGIGEKYANMLPSVSKALKGKLVNSAFALAMSGADEKRIQTFMNIVGGMNEAELTKAKIQLDMQKFSESLKSAQEKGLDALYAEIKGNPEAEAVFRKLKAVVVKSFEEAA